MGDILHQAYFHFWYIFIWKCAILPECSLTFAPKGQIHKTLWLLRKLYWAYEMIIVLWNAILLTLFLLFTNQIAKYLIRAELKSSIVRQTSIENHLRLDCVFLWSPVKITRYQRSVLTRNVVQHTWNKLSLSHSVVRLKTHLIKDLSLCVI